MASFRLDLVRKKSVPISARRSLKFPGQETELVSEMHTRGKALELFVLLEVCMSPVVLRHVGVVLHLLCEFQNQATVSFFGWEKE